MQPVVDIALFSRMAKAHCSAVLSLLWLRRAQALPRPHVPHTLDREKAPRQLPQLVGIGGVCTNPPEVTGASACPVCGDKEQCGWFRALLPASQADGRENIDLVVDEMGKGFGDEGLRLGGLGVCPDQVLPGYAESAQEARGAAQIRG